MAMPDTMTMASSMPFSSFSSTITMASPSAAKSASKKRHLQASQSTQRQTTPRPRQTMNSLITQDIQEFQATLQRIQRPTLGKLVATGTTDELGNPRQRTLQARKRLTLDSSGSDNEESPQPAQPPKKKAKVVHILNNAPSKVPKSRTLSSAKAAPPVDDLNAEYNDEYHDIDADHEEQLDQADLFTYRPNQPNPVSQQNQASQSQFLLRQGDPREPVSYTPFASHNPRSAGQQEFQSRTSLSQVMQAGSRRRVSQSQAVRSGFQSHTSPAQAARANSQDAQLPTSISGLEKASANTFIEYTKTEDSAILELEWYNRQQYLAGLSKEKYLEPVIRVFPEMSRTNMIFVKAVKKTRRDFKNWKSSVLRNVSSWVELYIEGHVNEDIRAMLDFKELRQAINEDFEFHWLEKIFHFAFEAVEFPTISPLGLSFLRYSCVLLMAHSRLSSIQQRYPVAPDLVKYNRVHFLDFYDGLYKYKEFASLSVEDFPMRSGPLIGWSLSRVLFNPNEDSDGDVGNDFFTATTTPVFNSMRQQSRREVSEEDSETYNNDAIDRLMQERGVPRLVSRNDRIMAITRNDNSSA